MSLESIANPPSRLPTREAGREFRDEPAASGSAGGERRTHQLDLPAEVTGLRLDQALARLLPQYSRARLQGWIETGAVLVDGRRPRVRDKVAGGERVRIEALIEARTQVLPQRIPLEIVYEDDALLVINKSAGQVVHPGAGNSDNTVQNALLALDPQLARVPRAGLVHRLDKDTSGLLVIARTPEAHSALVAAIAAREVERHYTAISTGVMTAGGTVDEPIGRHRTQRTRMAVRSDGREAVTHYRVLQRFRAHTLLRAQLETGRTHQIRVHLAHIGFPLVGDPMYGGRRRLPAGASPELVTALTRFRRQALHASRLALVHPIDGRTLHWEVPLPADMVSLLSALETDAKAASTTARTRR